MPDRQRLAVNVLSLWQPWASLIRPESWGKHIETRGWPAPSSAIGRPLAIHATKRPVDDAGRDLVNRWSLWNQGDALDSLPRGALLAVAMLQTCVRVPDGAAHLVRTREYPEGVTIPPPEPERSFGDYRAGRFAWILSDIVPLPRPIPANGLQGIWSTVEPAVCQIAAEIQARYEASLPRQEELF